MTGKLQPVKLQSVPVVEADVLDRMTETRELVAQRAYEIFQERGGDHGAAQDDWFSAEGDLIPKLAVEYNVSDDAVQFTAQIPNFNAKDLQVAVGHRRAVVCGIHSDTSQRAVNHHRDKKVMRIVELPFDVDPVLAKATLQNGILQVLLPRSR